MSYFCPTLTYYSIQNAQAKGPSTNYVVSVGEWGSSKDDLLDRPYLDKTTGGKESKIANFETTLFLNGPQG